MERYFTGKTVLVTGAGWGVGAATALLYASYGAKVVIADTSVKGGKNLAAKIKRQNGESSFIRTDVNSPSDCEKLIKRTIETYGSIDIACNNSAICTKRAHSLYKDMNLLGNEMSIDLNSLFYCMKYEIEAMQKKGGGVIINLAFVLGANGLASYDPFVAVKYGMNEPTQNIPAEFSVGGIRVNAVTPTFINTALRQEMRLTKKGTLVKLPAMGRIAKMEKVASVVVWLSSDKAPFTLRGDQFKVVDWSYDQN
jgi:NAD(P)-dependent dehydrogenase (short-subunit alcohol dehydrogenase family)